MNNITILQSKSLTPDVVVEFNDVLSELKNDSFKLPGIQQWRSIMGQDNLRFFVCHEKGKIIGMATLRWHELPGGKAATVEDVVVSAKYQGRGYGTKLTEAIIDFAKKKGIAYIDLTSRPERVAANKLYQKFGWKERRTNVYRLVLG